MPRSQELDARPRIHRSDASKARILRPEVLPPDVVDAVIAESGWIERPGNRALNSDDAGDQTSVEPAVLGRLDPPPKHIAGRNMERDIRVIPPFFGGSRIFVIPRLHT